MTTKFQADTGREPTFCIPAKLPAGLPFPGPAAASEIVNKNATAAGSHNPSVLAAFPALAAGCNKAIVVLDEVLLARPRSVLELFSALALHFKPGSVEVIPAGAYGHLFSSQIDNDLEAFSPTAVAVAAGRAADTTADPDTNADSDGGGGGGGSGGGSGGAAAMAGAVSQLQAVVDGAGGVGAFSDVIQRLGDVLVQTRAAELARSESYNFLQTFDFLRAHGLAYVEPRAGPGRLGSIFSRQA